MAALALAVELELFRDLEAALVLHPEGEERNNTSEGGSDELARFYHSARGPRTKMETK